MLEKAINRILELAAPNVQIINDQNYSDKKLTRIENELRAEPIRMNTLSSLVQYIKYMGEDRKSGKYLLHVTSPTEVRLVSALDDDREREVIAIVNAELPTFPFNSKVPHEDFLIGVQSTFVDDPNTDKALVLKFAGTVKAGTVTDYNDDGISQKATVKVGVASLSEAVVPSPCNLKPYRTFTEVDQPASSFIFRMSEEGRDGMICCALYEADGGAWKKDAKQYVVDYLRNELTEESGILIVS